MRLTVLALVSAMVAGCGGRSPPDPARRGPTEAAAPARASAPARGAPPAGDAAQADLDLDDGAQPFEAADPVSLWIRGGRVVRGDGTSRARRADVVVDADRIVWVGRVSPSLRAKETLDATGLVVAPGFVDMHAHTDPMGGTEHMLAQGVTTIVVGQDGFSPAERIGAWLDKVAASRPRINVATLVGHHTVRSASGAGASHSPGGKRIASMVELVDRAMRDGAFGLSTGLEYEPGGAASADELARIAAPVGRAGGLVMSHLRSEDDDRIDAALEELFDQCKRARARAHVAHLKIVLGKGEPRAKALLAKLGDARASGLEVTADLYPYTASYTTIGILFPAVAKPPNDYAASRAAQREKIRAHLRDRVQARNGPGAMLFGTGEHAGKTLAQVAEAQRAPFEDVLLDMGPSGASAAYFVMDEAVMEALFKDPFVMVGTDGGGGGLHPRGHGSFARVLARLVRERKLVTLEEAVRKMSALPAQTLGLSDRGAVRRGAVADLAVFDPAAVADTATFERPHVVAEGMKFVVVAGEIAFGNGKPTSARAGRALRYAGDRPSAARSPSRPR